MFVTAAAAFTARRWRLVVNSSFATELLSLVTTDSEDGRFSAEYVRFWVESFTLTFCIMKQVIIRPSLQILFAIFNSQKIPLRRLVELSQK